MDPRHHSAMKRGGVFALGAGVGYYGRQGHFNDVHNELERCRKKVLELENRNRSLELELQNEKENVKAFEEKASNLEQTVNMQNFELNLYRGDAMLTEKTKEVEELSRYVIVLFEEYQRVALELLSGHHFTLMFGRNAGGRWAIRPREDMLGILEWVAEDYGRLYEEFVGRFIRLYVDPVVDVYGARRVIQPSQVIWLGNTLTKNLDSLREMRGDRRHLTFLERLKRVPGDFKFGIKEMFGFYGSESIGIMFHLLDAFKRTVDVPVSRLSEPHDEAVDTDNDEATLFDSMQALEELATQFTVEGIAARNSA